MLKAGRAHHKYKAKRNEWPKVGWAGRGTREGLLSCRCRLPGEEVKAGSLLFSSIWAYCVCVRACVCVCVCVCARAVRACVCGGGQMY